MAITPPNRGGGGGGGSSIFGALISAAMSGPDPASEARRTAAEFSLQRRRQEAAIADRIARERAQQISQFRAALANQQQDINRGTLVPFQQLDPREQQAFQSTQPTNFAGIFGLSPEALERAGVTREPQRVVSEAALQRFRGSNNPFAGVSPGDILDEQGNPNFTPAMVSFLNQNQQLRANYTPVSMQEVESAARRMEGRGHTDLAERLRAEAQRGGGIYYQNLQNLLKESDVLDTEEQQELDRRFREQDIYIRTRQVDDPEAVREENRRQRWSRVEIPDEETGDIKTIDLRDAERASGLAHARHLMDSEQISAERAARLAFQNIPNHQWQDQVYMLQQGRGVGMTEDEKNKMLQSNRNNSIQPSPTLEEEYGDLLSPAGFIGDETTGAGQSVQGLVEAAENNPEFHRYMITRINQGPRVDTKLEEGDRIPISTMQTFVASQDNTFRKAAVILQKKGDPFEYLINQATLYEREDLDRTKEPNPDRLFTPKFFEDLRALLDSGLYTTWGDLADTYGSEEAARERLRITAAIHQDRDFRRSQFGLGASETTDGVSAVRDDVEQTATTRGFPTAEQVLEDRNVSRDNHRVINVVHGALEPEKVYDTSVWSTRQKRAHDGYKYWHLLRESSWRNMFLEGIERLRGANSRREAISAVDSTVSDFRERLEQQPPNDDKLEGWINQAVNWLEAKKGDLGTTQAHWESWRDLVRDDVLERTYLHITEEEGNAQEVDEMLWGEEAAVRARERMQRLMRTRPY